MEEIKQKLDRIGERLEGISVLQAIHTEQLKEHMRRSDLLERRIEQVDTDLKPVENHVQMVNGALKLIGLISTLIGLVVAITRIFT